MNGIRLETGVRDSGIIYTRLHEVPIYNSSYSYMVGTVYTKLWWRCSYNKNVTDFGVSRHEATPYSSYRGWTEYVGGYWVLPDNVRVSLVAYFGDMLNVYDLNQVFNLLGSGTYDYREF